MDPASLWSHLTQLAAGLGLGVRLEHLRGDDDYRVRGGLCRLAGKLTVFIDRKLPLPARCRQLGLALKTLDLNGAYVRPAVREYLDRLEPQDDLPE